MIRSYSKRFFCPKCGYTAISSPGNLCPNCGKRIAGSGWLSLSRKWAAAAVAAIFLLAGGLMYFHLFHPRAAAELSRAFHPLPKHFHIGIDVSASINQDALEKTKDVLVTRLKRFTDDETISYQVSTFGNPGCGKQSISTLLTLPSPENHAMFDSTVKKEVESITATPIYPRDITPLTTPIYCFLETALTPVPDAGTRIIIFSDLMNDDSDCQEQYIFPQEAIERFAADSRNEIIFLYTSPRRGSDTKLNRRLLTYQKEFIDRMTALGEAGKVRVFFRHIPEDPLKNLLFIRKELKKALPSTIGEKIRDRLSKIFNTIVPALTD